MTDSVYRIDYMDDIFTKKRERFESRIKNYEISKILYLKIKIKIRIRQMQNIIYANITSYIMAKRM